ncbi:copper homeostasis periplasmic binding protein CopC [Burkholderia gladioli]|jgi:methionine-rich copper-binding protein CopC|uniref:Copper homeostasis periplasmic binding protein CopC n=1 Tax=Burkholderia gladioli TaxID=28095 RepID=A0AB38TWP3_BURGA|nr:copper homeostasis periplasmic binding protein CopC [Burkholderia gladioli]ATF89693.1 copper resistance protein CopC [Burkholderia gladioli pv. gladioli]KAF1059521.1 Copper resistance protein C [Burkholderia gladioli]KKJ02658.1 copper resistance protein CopC [Burkholderia gladioli]MBJ9712229.1 copper homeostasis periplasmic binding protein CopC [Burkholderia gladioli]MBU9156122.1 copper homeostasis periplasmic binding protein CopC [Burkholderia gladioli]
MSRRLILPGLPFVVSALILASTASAHPALLASTPANQIEGPAPERIELRFSEDLMPRLSGAVLEMTAMPGMAGHAPMKIASTVSGTTDPKTMLIVPNQALQAGTYRVAWRAVSADTHPVAGSVSFTVR